MPEAEHHEHHHHHHHSHHLEADGFVSLSFESDQTLLMSINFNKFLNGGLPLEVFRAKGIVWFAGSQLRHIFQLCGQRNDIKSEPWSTPPAEPASLYRSSFRYR